MKPTYRVLVTGAAVNTGKAIALRFAQEGAHVLLNGRNADAATAAADELRALVPERSASITPLPADLSDGAQIDALFARIDSEVDGLDALVCNATHQGIGGPFLDTPLDLVEAVLRVNVTGNFHCAQSAARLMARDGGGSIVFLGSNCAERPIRNRSAYCASKGAIEALARSLAVELGPKNIRVNTVVPGYIWSNRWETLDSKIADRRRLNVPLGREATPDQVASAVYYFATSASDGVTGTRLVIDGGSTTQLYPVDCDG